MILDIDPDAGGAASLETLTLEHGEMPATTTVRTGSGGLHYYFSYPAGAVIRNSAGKLGPGLDIRGEGGCVVAPPSRTTGSYTPLERRPLADPPAAWLLEKLREPSVRPEKSSGGHNTPTPIMAAGEKIPEGARNDNLTRIAGNLHDGTRSLDQLTGELLEINARRCTPPLPDREVERIAASIHRREVPTRNGRMKPAVTTACVVLMGLLFLELWHISGQDFARFCLLLVLVGEAIFLSSLLLGDYSVMVLVVRRLSDWVVARSFLR